MNTIEAKTPKDRTDWESIEIFVFSNGQHSSPPRKYHLKAEELNRWDATLSFLAHSQYGNQHTMIYLYTTDGRMIEGPLELKDSWAYVAVKPDQPFIDAGYEKYLIKATRSWEKRQAKKNQPASEHGQSCNLCCMCPKREVCSCEYNVKCCLCPEKEVCSCEYNVKCCLCPEKEDAAAAETDQPLMAATGLSELKTSDEHSANSALSKKAGAAAAPLVGRVYKPKSDEREARSGENGTRIGGTRNRPGELRTKPDKYGPKPGEFEVVSRLSQTKAKPIEYGARPANYDARLGEEPQTDKIASQKGGHDVISGERETSLKENRLSEGSDRSGKYGGRPLKDEAKADKSDLAVDEYDFHYSPTSAERVSISGIRTKNGNYGPRSSERRGRSRISEIRNGEKGARSGENRPKSGDPGIKEGKSGTNADDYVGREGEYEGRVYEQKGKSDNHESRVGEDGRRSSEQQRRPGDHERRISEPEHKSGEHGRMGEPNEHRPGEYERKLSEPEHDHRLGEQERRLGEQEHRLSEPEYDRRSVQNEDRSSELEHRSSEHKCKSDEQRPDEHKGRFSESEHRSDEHERKSGDNERRSGEHDDHRSCQHKSSLSENERRSIESERRSGEHDKHRSGEHECISGEHERSLGEPDISGKHKSLSGVYERQTVEHNITPSGEQQIRVDPEARAREHPSRGSNHRGKWSEQGSSASDLGGKGSEHTSKVDDLGIRGGEFANKGGELGGKGVDHASRANYLGGRVSEYANREGDLGGRGSAHASKVGHLKGRGGEQRKSGERDEQKLDEHERISSEHERRLGELEHNITPAEEQSRRVDNPKARVSEHPKTGSEHTSRVDDLGGRGGEPTSRAGGFEVKGGEYPSKAHHLGERRGVLAGKGVEYASKVGDIGGKRDEHASRARDLGGKGGEHSSRAGNLLERVANPGTREPKTNELGSIVGERGAKASPRSKADESRPRKSPGARISPGTKVVAPGLRAGAPVSIGRDSGPSVGKPTNIAAGPDARVSESEAKERGGSGSEAAGFSHTSEAEQYVRKSSLLTGKTEKRRLSDGQHTTFRKLTPLPILPCPKKNIDDKNPSTSRRKSPLKKIAGNAPVRSSNEAAAVNETGEPKTVAKYPYKRFLPPTVPPQTATFNQTDIKTKATSVTNTTSNHKSLAPDIVAVQNVIDDKDIIMASTHLFRNSESEITSMKFDSDGRHLMDGIKESSDETQTEQIIIPVPVNEEVQTHMDQHIEQVDKSGQVSNSSNNTRVKPSPSSQRDTMIATEDTDENLISIINKGNVVNLKLNIEVRNGGRLVDSSQNTCQKCRSLTNITDNKSHLSTEKDMCVQSKSFLLLVNNECLQGRSFEGRPKVVVDQCACCGQKPINPPRCGLMPCSDSKKYFLLLPHSQHGGDNRCNCEPVYPSYDQTTNPQSKESYYNPLKQALSEKSMKTIGLKQGVEMTVDNNSPCQTAEKRSEYLVTKHKVSITKDSHMTCNFQGQSSSQMSVMQTKNSYQTECTQEYPQVNSQVCSQTQSQKCSQKKTDVCPQVQTLGCLHVSEVCPPLHTQECPQTYLTEEYTSHTTQPCPQLQAQQVCPKIWPKGCPQTYLHVQIQMCPQTHQANPQVQTQESSQIHLQVQTQESSQTHLQIQTQEGSQTQLQVQTQVNSQAQAQACLQTSPQVQEQEYPSVYPQLYQQVQPRACSQICPQSNTQVQAHRCPSTCPHLYPNVQSRVCSQTSQPAKPQVEPQGCPQLQSQTCSQACPQANLHVESQVNQCVQPQVYPHAQSQACVQAGPQFQSKACQQTQSQIRPDVSNCQTQTEWCSVLLEARRHDDGRYTFHLPPLHVLQYYTH